MYKVYCDKYLLYSDSIDNLKIFDAKLELELNKTNSFEFTIYPNHRYFDKLKKMKSSVKVYQDDDLIFKGRILNDEQDLYNEKKVICEGELAFLVDSIQRPYDFQSGSKHTTVSELFTYFINNHNSQVAADRRFKVGKITVIDSNNYIVRSETEYLNTWNSINEKLIKSLGGFLWVRHEADGNYIDYVSDFDAISQQEIRFGKNFLDINRITNGENIATAVIPIGATINDETGERLTISSVNDGVDYVFNQAAVDVYGWIFSSVKWDDVTIAANLKAKAEEYLTNSIGLQTTIELSAADLACIEADVESFKLATYVNVYSQPHGINSTYLVSKLSLDLMNPASNTLTLGATIQSLTEQTSNVNRSAATTESTLAEVKRVVDSMSESQGVIKAAVLQNGWLNYGGDYENACYWKDNSNNIHIAGVVKSGTATAGTTIFVLDTEYRPQASETFACASNETLCVIQIDVSGNVKIRNGGNNSYISLSGISFRKKGD